MKLDTQEIREIHEAAQLITSLRAGDIVTTTTVFHGTADPENVDALTAAQGQAEHILNTIDAAAEHDFYDSGIQFARVIHDADILDDSASLLDALQTVYEMLLAGAHGTNAPKYVIEAMDTLALQLGEQEADNAQ